MTDLSSLIEKMEAAGEGSRELDAEIMFDLFAKPVGKMEDGGPRGYLWPEDSPSWSFGLRFPGKQREWFRPATEDNEKLVIDRDGACVLMNSLRVPRLTTSLDAALSLVEQKLPGWYMMIDGSLMTSFEVSLTDSSVPTAEVREDVSRFFARGKTLPIALCLSLLKALQAAPSIQEGTK